MILKYLGRREWALLCIVAALLICQVYTDLSIPGYMNDITNAIQRGSGTVIVKECGVKMLVASLLSLVLAVVSSCISINVASSLCRKLRARQFEKVQAFSMQDIDRFSVASLITRSTNDTYQLLVFSARGIQVMIKAPIMTVWALSKISGGNWQWTTATGVALIVMLCTTSVILHYVIPRFRKIQSLMDGINRSVREDLDGIRVIRAYNADEHQRKNFDRSNDALIGNNVKAMHIMAPMYPISSSMNNFLTLAIYWIGAGLITATALQEARFDLFSDMIVFTSYAMHILSSVMMMAGVIRGLPRAMVASARVQEVIDTDPSIKDGPVDTHPDRYGEVEFKDVSFSYPGAKEHVLEHVSFKARKGETVAFIGSTGSGKSTLVNLIPRFYDVTEGQVLVNGIDVREYEQRTLRSMIGYVPQSAIIFTGSVRYNVNYGDTVDSRTEEDVKKALEIAQGLDFVEKMESGADSRISQYGRSISGGQKQRLCIARAVCKRPEIYIFDDTFSALDLKTDLALRTALAKEKGEATVIVVAQRVGTIIDADRIIVLDDGKVIGEGTHAQLMETCPEYREIAISQMAEVEHGSP